MDQVFKGTGAIYNKQPYTKKSVSQMLLHFIDAKIDFGFHVAVAGRHSESNYYTVCGLPISTLVEMLEKLGVE